MATFIKQFPSYLARVESQLVGTDGMEIRSIVNEAYDKIVQSMFDCLKQMAKMDGEGEDKGQLNYHVILIGRILLVPLPDKSSHDQENMHHFVAEITQSELGSVAGFLKRAEIIYEENLSAYVRLVIRRPFGKIIVSSILGALLMGNLLISQEYFEGVDRILKNKSANEVANNSNYSKSALKKVLKEYNSRDVRKHIDTLFKRVEKHFEEASEKPVTDESGSITPGTVLVGVWKACEEETLRATDMFTKRITQCYGDSGITLEYLPTDIEASFKRHRA